MAVRILTKVVAHFSLCMLSMLRCSRIHDHKRTAPKYEDRMLVCMCICWAEAYLLLWAWKKKGANKKME